MVPLGIGGRQGEELALVREGRLRPGPQDDLVGLFEIGSVALLVLVGRAQRAAQRLRFARLHSPSHAELQAATTEHVQHRRLLRQPQRVVPGEDVGELPQADAAGAGGDGRLGEEGGGAMRGALRLEVVLGQKVVVEAQLFRQDPLADLAESDTLLGRARLRQGAGVHADPCRRHDDREVDGAALEDPYLQHGATSGSGTHHRPR